jgi:putative ABC transport system permease protein
MKYVPLLWYGLRRRPLRTALVVLQIAVVIGLFGVLQGVQGGASALMARTRADLLTVESLRPGPLPLAYWQSIRKIPGVKEVAPENLLRPTYVLPTQHVTVFSVDLQSGLKVIPVTIARSLVHAMDVTRTGAVATTALANRYGWKPGDRIHLNTRTPLKGGVELALDFLGTFTPVETNGTSEVLIMNNAYFDELRKEGQGTIDWYNVSVMDASRTNEIAKRIDDHFQNSANPTRSTSMLENAQDQIKQISDLEFSVRAITGAALFALLISVGAILSASVRERLTEMAVMKTIGFSSTRITAVLIGESLVICAAATVIGFLSATVIFAKAQVIMLGLSMPPIVIAQGAGLATVIALVVTAIPAWILLRMDVVRALGAQ